LLSGHQSSVSGVAISPDNRWIVTVSHDGTVRLWKWRWNDLLDAAEKVGRNLTKDEWKRYLPDTPYRKTFSELPVPGETR
jgi:WD40 repeat protein